MFEPITAKHACVKLGRISIRTNVAIPLNIKTLGEVWRTRRRALHIILITAKMFYIVLRLFKLIDIYIQVLNRNCRTKISNVCLFRSMLVFEIAKPTSHLRRCHKYILYPNVT